MLNLLVPFLLLTLRACVNTHSSCHYLYSQDILLTILLSASLQPEVRSRSHNGCFIWKPYHRNLRCHSVSGCAGNSETSDFTFKFTHSATTLGLKNASQTKGQFRLTLILPPWHSFSSVCLKFKACPGFKCSFLKSLRQKCIIGPTLRRGGQ